MLSIHSQVRIESRRPASARTARIWQRRIHLVTAAAVAAYVYSAPDWDSPVSAAVRWLVLPTLVASGIAMWQLPRLRRLQRKFRGHR